MLRISIIDTRSQRRLILEGTLVEPWASELRTSWQKASEDLGGRRRVIDLRNVTSINQEGESALMDLMCQGAQFRCRGVLIQHVLKQLTHRRRAEAGKIPPLAHAVLKRKKESR